MSPAVNYCAGKAALKKLSKIEKPNDPFDGPSGWRTTVWDILNLEQTENTLCEKG